MLNLIPDMFSPPTSFDDVTIPMVITQGARLNAQRFRHQQPNEAKGKQVFRNTVAVSVVHSYLQMLGIEADLKNSDCWHPILQLANDIADLRVPQGQLECRWVSPTDTSCYVPLEVHCDRIGYIVVRLDSEQEATLLGFVDQVTSNSLPLEQLRPMSELPRYLSQLRSVVDLRQWLEGIYQINWQPPENWLSPKQLALSPSQAGIQRAKLIELNLCAEHRDVILLLAVTPQDDSLSVKVQLHPVIVTDSHPVGTRLIQAPIDCLTPNIKLALQMESGTLAKEVMARTYPRDNCIQIPQFQGQWGEHFTIQISMNDYQVNEHFQL